MLGGLRLGQYGSADTSDYSKICVFFQLTQLVRRCMKLEVS